LIAATMMTGLYVQEGMVIHSKYQIFHTQQSTKSN
jgi:hypothetical protein